MPNAHISIFLGYDVTPINTKHAWGRMGLRHAREQCTRKDVPKHGSKLWTFELTNGAFSDCCGFSSASLLSNEGDTKNP